MQSTSHPASRGLTQGYREIEKQAASRGPECGRVVAETQDRACVVLSVQMI
jgi:hypothetical protein